MDDANTGLAGTILVINDERNIRRTLRMVLEGEGATVLDAETAEAGLKLIEQSLADGAAGRSGDRGGDGRRAAAGDVGPAAARRS